MRRPDTVEAGFGDDGTGCSLDDVNATAAGPRGTSDSADVPPEPSAIRHTMVMEQSVCLSR